MQHWRLVLMSTGCGGGKCEQLIPLAALRNTRQNNEKRVQTKSWRKFGSYFHTWNKM